MTNEPQHDKTNKMACAPSEDWSAWASTQFEQSHAVRMKKVLVLATHWAHSEDPSDWVDAQADLSLHWVHMPYCWFCRDAAQMGLSNLQG